MAGECPDWISDYVIGILKSPTWVAPISEFIDERCTIFDDVEENEFEHTQCHNDFKHLVNQLFTTHLVEISVTPEQFDSFCERGLADNHALHKVLVEQLLAVDDFLTFKAMMTKHNAQLAREVVYYDFEDDQEEPFSATEAVAHSVVAKTVMDGMATSNTAYGWNLYEDQMQRMGVDLSSREYDEDGLDAMQRCEEAALEQAIALSLQLEEERLRLLAIGEGGLSEAALVVPEAPPLPPTAGFLSAPLMPRPFAIPKPAEPAGATAVPDMVVLVAPRGAWGFTSAPLMHYVPSQTPQEFGIPAPVAEPAPVTVAEVPVVPIQVPPAGGIRSVGFTSSPLCFVPPKPKGCDFGSTAISVLSVESYADESNPIEGQAPQTQVEGMRSNLALWRERAERAFNVSVPFAGSLAASGNLTGMLNVPPPVEDQVLQIPKVALSRRGSNFAASLKPGPTPEERQARQEHLNRQRDRLIAKRKMKREQQIGEFQRLHGRAPPAPSAPQQGVDRLFDPSSVAGRRLVAELTPGAVMASEVAPPLPEPAVAAERMRQALTLQLRSSLLTTMVSDAKHLDNQISQLENLRAGM